MRSVRSVRGRGCSPTPRLQPYPTALFPSGATTPLRAHLALLVRVVQVGGDAAPQHVVDLGHAPHGFEEQPQVAEVARHLVSSAVGGEDERGG